MLDFVGSPYAIDQQHFEAKFSEIKDIVWISGLHVFFHL